MPVWDEYNPHTPPEARRDPSFELAAASRFADYRDEDGDIPEWFPVILQLSVSAQDFAHGIWDGPPPAGWRGWIRVPGIYRRLPFKLTEFRFCTATVRRRFFDEVRQPGSLRDTVVRFELCMPLNRDTSTEEPETPMFPRDFTQPNAVVTGVIDDGLAFAHEQFRLAGNRTRVHYFWDQDGIPPPGTVPPGLGYGRESLKRTRPGRPGLDARIGQATHGGLVDEDQVYANTGALDYTRSGHKALGRRIAHGTHAMHAACKVDRPVDLPDRPIVCVQLPSRSVADTSGTSLARHILDGLIYILRRADRIARARRTNPLPVVVNVSFGNIAGPHDGTSILEAAMDELIELRQALPRPAPLAIVLPAGNAHLSRCHARFELPRVGDIQTLGWRVQPDDATPSNLQIYTYRRRPRADDVAPRIAIRVTTPTGSRSPWIELGGTFAWQEGPWVLCAATNLPAISTGGSAVAQIWLAPTVTQHPTRVVAPSGLWRVEVRRRSGGRPFEAWAWIQRDDRPFGYPVRGRQSRFEDRLYVHRDQVSGRHVEDDLDASPIKRGGLMNAFATGSLTIAIGGFRGGTRWGPGERSWRAWERSAGGPLARRRRGPDALAISEDSEACHGRLGAGTRSGRLVAMNGSSVAAPQVANFLVEEAAAGRAIDRAAVRREAARQETTPPPRPPRPKPQRGGRGRIVRKPLQRVSRA
jgi:hypothetical protein